MKPELVRQKNGCEIDIPRTAKALIEQHGRDAVLVAARWADCAARAADLDRAAAWRQIVDAIRGHGAGNPKPRPAGHSLSARSRAA